QPRFLPFPARTGHPRLWRPGHLCRRGAARQKPLRQYPRRRLFAHPSVRSCARARDASWRRARCPLVPCRRSGGAGRGGAAAGAMTLFSIAPHARFIPTLAERVLDGTLLGGWDRSDPFWLADVTIILPTRRARLALADAFARRGHGLLPDIRTLGGEVEDEEPFLPPFDAPPLPPAASTLERRLVLSQLVAAWANTAQGRQAFSSPPTAAEILAMAESLGELIDDLATEERSAADIRAIAPEIGSELGAY